MVNPKPDNYSTVNPSLAVTGASDAIAFYIDVFGATERMRMASPDGKVAHAELQFGDSVVMINDEFPEYGSLSPHTVGGTPVSLSVYVDDVDATFAKAVDAGGKAIMEPMDQFYGDRSGQFEDPWGHKWGVSTHIEDVSPEEMERRMAEQGG